MPLETIRRLKAEEVNNIPKAHSFQLATCNDPGCGLHVMSANAAGEYICELVIGYDQIPLLCDHLMTIYRERQQ